MRIVALLALLLAGCPDPLASTSERTSIPAGWIEVTAACGYSFMAPPDMINRNEGGIDSCVDRWFTDSCSLVVDFGAYSSAASETPGLVDFEEWSEVIDGRVAQLSTAKNELISSASRFESGVHFALVEPPYTMLKVSASCPNEADRDETLLLFRSIRFPDDLAN